MQSNAEAKPSVELRRSGSIRWWPVPVLLVLASSAVIWIRSFYGRQRQDQYIATANIVFITILLLLLWCLFFSRLKWKVRWGVLGAVVAAILLTPALFRIHGVTGDLLPRLEWRWQTRRVLPPNHLLSSAPHLEPTEPAQLTNDYPQFLGPQRNSRLDGPRLARDWKKQPPQLLWHVGVGAGWSGFAVAGRHAITQEQRGEKEMVICYDLLSGKMLWSHGYAARYFTTLAGEGPRATPTISRNRVYVQGATGILTCLDLTSGQLHWSKDIVQDNGAHLNEWGVSCSPLVVDGLIVVSAGGKNNRSLVAYRADTGAFVWGGGDRGAGYSSPLLTTLAGVQQIIIFNSGGVFAHSPADGAVLWKYPWPGGHPHVSTPLVLPEDRVLVSSGYGVGSELLQISRNSDGKLSAARIWKSNRLKAKFANLTYRDGRVYGLDDGILVCLEASTGEQKWKEGRYGHGQEILVGDLLLVMAEAGEVILLEPTPKEARELTRFTALKGKTWNPPALAGEFLVVRNDKEAACYRLPVMKQIAPDSPVPSGQVSP